ncbi:hypothetical protein D3C76_1507980 [compost metagenome]
MQIQLVLLRLRQITGSQRDRQIDDQTQISKFSQKAKENPQNQRNGSKSLFEPAISIHPLFHQCTQPGDSHKIIHNPVGPGCTPDVHNGVQRLKHGPFRPSAD